MFSKFKILGLNVLKNLNAENLFTNFKRSLPQLATVRNDNNYNNDYRNRKSSNLLLRRTNYLLVSVLSLGYLDKKYDILKNLNCIDEFTVSAKEPVKNDEILLINKADKKESTNSIRSTFNFIADAAEKAIPCVVHIKILDPYFGHTVKASSGSGFVVRSNGLILTNAHVVDGFVKVNVELQSGEKLIGTVECVDNLTDLALVKVEATNLPTLEFEPLSSGLRVGEFVIAIGYPFSLSNSVTSGIVSCITEGKHLGLPNDEMKYIQTDASINIGNSGGPLISLSGNVIGICTYKVTNGINYAIPAENAIRFLNNAEKALKENRKKKEMVDKKKYFGLTMLSLTGDVLQQVKEKFRLDNITYGVILINIGQNSIAEKAGLRAGDIIIDINNNKVTTSSDVYNAIDSSSSLSILVVRSGKKIKFNVNLI